MSSNDSDGTSELEYISRRPQLERLANQYALGMTEDQLKKWKEDWTRQVEIEFEADKIRKLDVLHERLPEDGKGVATGPARTIPETLHTFGGPRKSLLTNVRIQASKCATFQAGPRTNPDPICRKGLL